MAKRTKQSGAERSQFRPEILQKSIIAIPLLELMKKHPEESIHVIIDLNFDYVKSLLEDGILNYLDPAENQRGAAGLSNAAFPTVSDPTASDPTAADAMDMQNEKQELPYQAY